MPPTQSRPLRIERQAQRAQQALAPEGKAGTLVDAVHLLDLARTIAPPNISSARKNWPANGPNLPPVLS